jgi:peptidoglycan/xylan/chitin deacetylase (PgdA/CDA1 family)
MRALRRLVFPFTFLLLQGCAAGDGDDHDHANEADEWNTAYENEIEGKADGGCSGVRVPDRGGIQKRVALTFDDGPNAATTPKVLDILKARGIKATFFINGARVGGTTERQILTRILAEGHILANHSQQHLNLAKVSQSKFDDQVKQTDAILSTAGETRKWFRFPFGSATCGELARVRDHFGYTTTGWHVDSGDWCFAAGGGTCKKSTFKHIPDGYRNDMDGWVMKQVRAQSGGIVLFHDIHPNTVAHLEPIIQALTAEGYSFTNVDDDAVFPQLNGKKPSFIGSSCKTASECAFTANGANAACHTFLTGGQTRGFCTAPCNGTCPDRDGYSPTFCVSLDGASGKCAAKSTPANAYCAMIPGTTARSMPRFVGTSGAASATATVCVP